MNALSRTTRQPIKIDCSTIPWYWFHYQVDKVRYIYIDYYVRHLVFLKMQSTALRALEGGNMSPNPSETEREGHFSDVYSICSIFLFVFWHIKISRVDGKNEQKYEITQEKNVGKKKSIKGIWSEANVAYSPLICSLSTIFGLDTFNKYTCSFWHVCRAHDTHCSERRSQAHSNSIGLTLAS